MSNRKKILDPCCGSRMFYFDKKNPLVAFGDNRNEEHTLCDGRNLNINPDEYMDFTNLNFNDESFELIIFDPPHIKRGGDNSWIVKKYGRLNQSWKEDLKKGFSECFRVLKNNGCLIFKWNETQIPVLEILKLTPNTPIIGHKSGKRMDTHWLLFFKDEDHD